MKINNKMLIIACSVLTVVLVFCMSAGFYNNKKLLEEKNYKLIITSIYRGYGIGGEKLETETETKTFKNIKKGDVFDNNIYRNLQADHDFLVLKIIDVSEDFVEVEYYVSGSWVRIKMKYGEKIDFMPEYEVIYDGLNQTIEFYFEK